LNCITVVPGAIGAFRRQAIGSVGWYETDTLAEDCDLTMRIIRKGYKVVQNNDAIAITESPETYKQFLKQRFRWSFGVMQAFWKNKHVLFNRHYESLGMVAFPNILIFGMILPLLAPIADFTLIFTYIFNSFVESAQHSGQAGDQKMDFFVKYHMLIMYLAFMSVDLVVCIAAFLIQKESLKTLWLMFPQRIVYRPLMYYVVFQSYKKALKGELMGWGVLKRTGSIGQVAVTQSV
jgi:peptidoglycan-N-acetylglucosamine deacetylase